MTSGKVQFFEHVQRVCFVFSANQIYRFNSEHAQKGGKSVDPGLPVPILGADQKVHGLCEQEGTVPKNSILHTTVLVFLLILPTFKVAVFSVNNIVLAE